MHVIDNIENWGLEKGIRYQASVASQFGKLEEELDELKVAIAKGNHDEFEDAIGDMAVVLILMARMGGTYFEVCLNRAWNEIKNRKGRMVDGVFVKEGQVYSDVGE